MIVGVVFLLQDLISFSLNSIEFLVNIGFLFLIIVYKVLISFLVLLFLLSDSVFMVNSICINY